MKNVRQMGKRLLSMLLALLLAVAAWGAPAAAAKEEINQSVTSGDGSEEAGKYKNEELNQLVTRISVPSELVLVIGESREINVTIPQELLKNGDVQYTTSDSRIVNVNWGNRLEPVKEGRATITSEISGTYFVGDGIYEEFSETRTTAVTVIEAPEVQNPVYNELTDTTSWDYVWFGSYPQHEVKGSELTKEIKRAAYVGLDANVDGVRYRRVKDTIFGDVYRYYKWEPIKWRVLQAGEDSLFLLADTILDSQVYGGSASYPEWYDSDIRAWLRGSFYGYAFNGEERGIVRESTEDGTGENVFLLSLAEATATAYGFSDWGEENNYVETQSRALDRSDYASDRGAGNVWWLRTNSEESSDGSRAFAVDNKGSIYSNGTPKYANGSREEVGCGVYAQDGIGVVPALRIDKRSSLWSLAEETEPLQAEISEERSAESNSVTFHAKASGGEPSPYTYQWYREEVEVVEPEEGQEGREEVAPTGRVTKLEGAVSADYTIADGGREYAGAYFCEVSDGKTIAHSGRIGWYGLPVFETCAEQGIREENVDDTKCEVSIDVYNLGFGNSNSAERDYDVYWYRAASPEGEGKFVKSDGLPTYDVAGGRRRGYYKNTLTCPIWIDGEGEEYYYVELMNRRYGTIASPRVKVAMYAKPEVTDPVDQCVKLGSSASFRVEASGGYPSCTYQWYCAPNSLGAGQPIEGATSAVYEIPAREVTSSLNGYFFYCVADNGQYTVTTAKAKLTVYGGIDVNKRNLSAAIRQAEAIEEKGYTSESWERLQDALEAAHNVYEDRDIPQQQIVDEACESLLEAIEGLEKDNTIWVTGITLKPAVLSLTVGDEAKLEAALEPANATHQEIAWSSSDETVAAVVPQAGTGMVMVKGLKEGAAVITAKADDVEKICVVTVVAKGSVAKLQVSAPDSQAVKTGTGVSFRVEATGGYTPDYEYQWYWADSEDGAGTKIKDATLPEYALAASEVTKELNGRYYYCVVKSQEEEAASGRAKLTVYFPPSVSTPKSQSVKTGSSVSFSVEASGGSPAGYTYQWYYATSENGAGTKVKGAVADTYTIPAKDVTIGMDGRYYYCVASNGLFEAESGRAKLAVAFQTPKLTVNLASASAVKLTWTKAPGAEGYYVYRSTSKGGKYAKAGTAKGTSFTDKKLKAGKTYYYKVAAYKGKTIGSQSGASSKKILGKLSTPKLKLSKNSAKRTFTLSWKQIKNADKVEIWRKVDKNGSYKKWKTIPGKKKNATYSYKGYAPGHDYFYQIRAYYKRDKTTVYSFFSNGLGIRL